MEETNINIYLYDEKEKGTPSNPTKPGSSPNPNNPTQQKQDKGKEDDFSTKAIGVYVAKQALNIATTRVGQVTRSSILQDKVNASLKIMGYASAIAVNPIMGSLALGFDLFNSTLNYYQSAQQESNYLKIMSQRAGNINRSR